MRIFKPPSVLPQNSDIPAVFLAGSIEQGTAPDWQLDVTTALSDLELNIFNPRRDQWDATWVQRKDNPAFRAQVEWELDALELADWIVIYFAPQTKAPITLLEFGLFARSQKLLVCCPEGFWRRGNVEIVADRFNISLYATFEPFLAAIRQAITKQQ
ncbi:MAG: nucleoside 2-deoxyribosyltransferase domain-containing protein [Cyanobacteria bacterium P01_H01_bin.121]